MLPLNWRNRWDTAFEFKLLLMLISGISTLLSHFQVSHQLYCYCLLNICTMGMQCWWLTVLFLDGSSCSYVLTVSGCIIGLIKKKKLSHSTKHWNEPLYDRRITLSEWKQSSTFRFYFLKHNLLEEKLWELYISELLLLFCLQLIACYSAWLCHIRRHLPHQYCILFNSCLC